MDSGRGHNRDRISNLPDEVLCHILSFLPTKFAVGASILSRRWRYVWVSISNLEFVETLLLDHRARDEYESPETSQSFINFVNIVLLHSDVSHFKKFTLELHRICNPAIVEGWIRIALERNVQELDLYVGYDVILPHTLFTSKTLVVLKLSSLIPELPASVWLPSLKILHLVAVVFSKADSAQELFIGCPMLEDLVIWRDVRGTSEYQWDYQWDFIVSSPSLKRLTIDALFDDLISASDYKNYECKLVIDSPNLEYLSLRDYMVEDYSLCNLSSLTKAHIDVQHLMGDFVDAGDFGDRVYKLLRGISNVKFLSVSDDALFCLMHANHVALPTFHNLTNLDLAVSNFGWNLLTNFLKRSPNLEVLVLGPAVMSSIMFGPWRPPKRVPKCLISHLKEIIICDFCDSDDEAARYDVVEYLLKNAKVLKKMEIYCGCLRDEGREELSSYPRGSKGCQLCLL